MADRPKTVFISYAHEDRKWVEELQKMLSPWLRDNRVSLWDDSQIAAGAKWGDEIQRALTEAKVAVLFVTKDFLSSSFIMDVELPQILKRAEEKTLRLIWVATGFAPVGQTPLRDYQAANDPEKPLESLSEPEQNKELLSIAHKIENAATLGSLARGLQIIDETTEPLEARIERRSIDPDRQYSVQSQFQPQEEQITFTGTSLTISYKDLDELPDNDREFIADREDAMGRHYERYRRVRKEIGKVASLYDEELEAELDRIMKYMCKELNEILDFLRKIHQYELEDHYGRYRYLCDHI